MKVVEIQVDDFRVLEKLSMKPGQGVSLILGRNGSGKTSIIEALYVAGRGSSFRHREVRPWIRDGRGAAKVFVRTESSVGKEHRIGIVQNRGSKIVKVDGEMLGKKSQLARVMPVQLITPNSHDLIERGPSVRRRFLDWGLFHVEHRFAETAQKYRRALVQRNQALKRGDESFSAWDELLAVYGEAIDCKRQALLPYLQKNMGEELAALDLGDRVELTLVLGWDQEAGLLNVLTSGREIDQRRRITGFGAHRTSLNIEIDGVPAERRLSRGQQKILVYGLMFALTRYIAQSDGEKPILLIDDLPAELDEANQTRVIERAIELGLQTFVTATHVHSTWGNLPIKVFHVEHGEVRVN